VTFADITGAKLSDTIKPDGQSFGPQLRGQAGTPRPYAYVQLGERWFVREPGFKLNEAGDLFDMSDAPFVEKPIAPTADTDQSKAARQRLTAALTELNPAAGKKDGAGGGKSNASPTGPWKTGDTVAGAQAPQVAGKAIHISAEIDPTGTDGVILSQGAGAQGYAIYLKDGKLAFAVRENKALTTVIAKDPLGNGHFTIEAELNIDGTITLTANNNQIATGKATGPSPQQPRAALFVGPTGRGAVGDYDPSVAFKGKIANVTVKAGDE
jgi:hypothetical protein